MKRKNKILQIISLNPLLFSLMSSNSIGNYQDNFIITVKENSNLVNYDFLKKLLNDNSINFSSLEKIGNNLSQFYKVSFKDANNLNKITALIKENEYLLDIEKDSNIIFNDEDEDNTSYVNEEGNISTISDEITEHFELMNAIKARDITGKNNKVNIAVIDSGININSMFVGSNVDLNRSKSFDSKYGNLGMRSGHGTGVSFLIGGVIEDSHFPSGICKNANLISVLIPEDCSKSTFLSAIEYVKNFNDIPLINLSFSMGSDTSEAIKESIRTYNGLFICCASNEESNLEDSNYYPAKYSLDNMIVVGESTLNETKSRSSNYSSTLVDVFAPSYNIYTIEENDNFSAHKGTSFATALVTGTCAQILSNESGITREDIKDRIMTYAKKIPALKDSCVDGNRLDVFESLHAKRENNSYFYIDTSYHNQKCNICGENKQVGHTISGGINIGTTRFSTCIYCKGKAAIGFINSTNLNNIQYDFINGLYYPKETYVIDGITDLSYEDSLKYE